jgi:hypothetical protein
MTNKVDPFETVSEREGSTPLVVERDQYKEAYKRSHEYGVNASTSLIQKQEELKRMTAERERYKTALEQIAIVGGWQMIVKVIKTSAEHEAALSEVEALWDAVPGTPEHDRLELLGVLIDDYENKMYPIGEI